MAKDDSEIPYVDYVSIQFPSDRLTIGDLRRIYPTLFDPQGPPALEKEPDWADWAQLLRSRGIPISNPRDGFLEMLRALPGDASTILDLRRKYPDIFDVEYSLTDVHPLYRGTNELFDVLWRERTVARMAFQEGLNQPEDLPKGIRPDDRECLTKELIDEYIRLGIASGEHKAAQMIRKFTSQAMAQAKLSRGGNEDRSI